MPLHLRDFCDTYILNNALDVAWFSYRPLTPAAPAHRSVTHPDDWQWFDHLQPWRWWWRASSWPNGRARRSICIFQPISTAHSDVIEQCLGPPESDFFQSAIRVLLLFFPLFSSMEGVMKRRSIGIIKVREIIRLRHQHGLSMRKISSNVNVSVSLEQ